MPVDILPINQNDISQNETSNLIPPDPSYQVAEFLQYLKKRGGFVYLKECKTKWEREGLDVENIVKALRPHIGLYRARGKIVVVLENKPWATQWLQHYDLEVPHHRHQIKI
jgi:hypothetical protein